MMDAIAARNRWLLAIYASARQPSSKPISVRGGRSYFYIRNSDLLTEGQNAGYILKWAFVFRPDNDGQFVRSVERGHPVVVGSRVAIHNRIHVLPRGLYLAKDIRSSSRRMFRIMDKLGFAIAAWDEEAIVVIDPATYHERRVDTENLNRIKAFLAWGAHDRELIESAPGYRGTPVYETGNPRIDLLTPRCRRLFEPEVAALRARFGAFILINSNFGRINHFLNNQAATRTADGGYTNLDVGTPECLAVQ